MISAASGAVPVARPARPADVERLAEMYLEAADELSPMRGGRVLLGLNRRERPVVSSFTSQLEDPRQFVVVAALGSDDIVGYGTCRTLTLSEEERVGSIQISTSLRQRVGQAPAVRSPRYLCGGAALRVASGWTPLRCPGAGP